MLRKVVERLALVFIGLVLSCILTEVVLQIGGLYVRATSEAAASSWKSGSAVRVLALGDSNTYGLYLEDRDDAYPSVVQTLWRERHSPEPAIEVINAGVPGTNSSRVRRDIQRLLETFRPDVITLMVGANDYWTEPVPFHDESLTLGNRLWEYSRLYRLFYMLRRTLENYEVQIEFDDPEGYRPNRGTIHFGSNRFDLGWTKQKDQASQVWIDQLTENLTSIADLAETLGVHTILLTYPSPSRASYLWANDRIIAVAEKLEVLLVDSRSVFMRNCAQAACGNLLYTDHHPTAQGHRLIAEALLDQLLIDRGLVASDKATRCSTEERIRSR
ncbi:MAG: SGNH/GDSL hydrolase family protein [Myxococcales bacterium]|nr:SGNH/GDSL hydrolase family protein [Myxococcales bacterium]